MKPFIRQVLLGLFFIAFAGSTVAKPIEVRSENFVLIGSLNTPDAKSLLAELEQYRWFMLQMLGADPVPEPVPVRIYTTMGDRELEALTGRTDIGGIYTTNIEGPIFILDAKRGFKRGKRPAISLCTNTHTIS
jgi:hypothetical protein